MAGKGDTPRPISISQEELERRWAETFGPRPKPTTPKPGVTSERSTER